MREDTSGQRETQRPMHTLLLLGVGLLGVGLRMTRLLESLWYDEIAAWRDYGIRGAAYALTHYHDPANHVLHTALTAWSVALMPAGWSVELALRLPALLFSTASLLVMYLLGRRVGGKRVGLLCAVLSAVLPINVLEGADARGYSMMIGFAAASTWVMFELLQRRRPWSMLPLYAIVTTLGIWAHLMTVFVPIGHAAYLLWLTWRDGTRRRAAAFGLAGIAFAAALTLAAYAPILEDIWRLRATFHAQAGDQPHLFGVEGLHALLGLGGAWTWWAALPGLAVFVYGLIMAQREQKAARARALALLGLPVMASVVLLAGTWIYARFTLFALPGVMLVMAVGIEHIWRRGRQRGLVVIVVIVLASIVDLMILPARQPLRDAVQYVRLRQPTRPVVVIGLHHDVLDVYAGDLELRYSGPHGAQLEQALREAQPNWVIVYFPARVDRQQYELLDRHGFAGSTWFEGWLDWGDGDVLVYERVR